jgi:sterol desaturase/sphingolipid hydroxylase (fatty acid hydroxylase superfamily)
MPNNPVLHDLMVLSASGLCFVLVCGLVFWPLEELFAEENQPRPSLKDLAYMWFYQSIGLWIAAGIIYEVAFFMRQFLPAPWLVFVKHQPFWLQAAAALVMAEIWVYTFHRLAHTLPCLWKFHRVHHTVVDMTWSATSRQHPVDFLLIIVGANLPAMLLGIDLKPIVLLVILERIYTVLLHSNLDIHYGCFTKIIASPRLHRLHHTPKSPNGNYAGILSLLDVLGNTFQSPQQRDP